MPEDRVRAAFENARKAMAERGISGYMSGAPGKGQFQRDVGQALGEPILRGTGAALRHAGKSIGAVGKSFGRGAGRFGKALFTNPPRNINIYSNNAAKSLEGATEGVVRATSNGIAPAFKVWGLKGQFDEYVKPTLNKTIADGRVDFNRLQSAGLPKRAHYEDTMNDELTYSQRLMTKLAAPGRGPRGGGAGRAGGPRNVSSSGGLGGSGAAPPASFGGYLARGAGEALGGSPVSTLSQTMGDVAKNIASPSAGTLGYQLQRSLFPLADRVRAADIMAETALKEGTKGLAQIGARRIDSLIDQGINSGRDVAVYGPQRRRIYDQLMSEDEILSRADPQQVMSAYQTLKTYAPILSTDPAVARSFLRDAVMHEGAINYNTIGQLAKAESDTQRMQAGVSRR